MGSRIELSNGKELKQRDVCRILGKYVPCFSVSPAPSIGRFFLADRVDEIEILPAEPVVFMPT